MPFRTEERYGRMYVPRTWTTTAPEVAVGMGMVSRERGSDVDFRMSARWVAILKSGTCDLRLREMGG